MGFLYQGLECIVSRQEFSSRVVGVFSENTERVECHVKNLWVLVDWNLGVVEFGSILESV